MTSISSSTSSSTLNSATSTTGSSSKVDVPEKLTKYLSNTKSHSRKLSSAIDSLYSESSDDLIGRAAENFVKYYNKTITDNSGYDDSGLDDLTTKLKKIVDNQSSLLSDLGITVKSNGKLQIDSSTLKTAISDYTFSDFLTSNESSGGMFGDISEIAKKLYKDNTYYLSSKAKKILTSASS